MALKIRIEKWFVCGVIPAIALLIGAWLVRAFVHGDGRAQEKFLRSAYQEHVSSGRYRLPEYTMPPNFFSKNATVLIDVNHAQCVALARDGRVCGYGANADVLFGREPMRLAWDSLGFRSEATGQGTIAVTVTLDPRAGDYGLYRQRFSFVREDEQWRVDDIAPWSGTAYDPSQSMRNRIKDEDERLVKSAADVKDVLASVFVSLARPETSAAALRFLRFPLEVCLSDGSCRRLQEADPGVVSAMTALQSHYAASACSPSIEWEGRVGQTPGTEQRALDFDALRLRRVDNVWWVAGVDLARLGSDVAKLTSP